MYRTMLTVAVVAVCAGPASALPDPFGRRARGKLDEVNQNICGRVLDFSGNHGTDNRLWSSALGEKRDCYVYLPPGYDGTTPFPAMLWMHGFGSDEKNFLEIVPVFDEQVRTGRFPPLIVIAPDGRIPGKFLSPAAGSFYLNSNAGRYEDYIFYDVWGFLLRSFCVHPDRGAHVSAGGSMGGFGAYHTAFKHRESFGVIVGLLPPLDVRYANCRNRYLADFDPLCNAYRDTPRPNRVIGRFYGGLIRVREARLTEALIGKRNPDGLGVLAPDNPVEMLDLLNICPDEFAMFVGYAGKDEFNLDAQAEHFLAVARGKGIEVTSVVEPNGRHRLATAFQLVPPMGRFLCEKLAAYVPAGYAPQCRAGLPTDLLTSRPGLLPFRRTRGSMPWNAGSPLAGGALNFN